MTSPVQKFDVVVAGAGISGIHAALELAELDCRVLLVERSPVIGGLLMQLDHQFPNNHCGMCRMLPMIGIDDCSRTCLRQGLDHQRIDIMPLSEVVSVSGSPGDLTVGMTVSEAKPREIAGVGAVIFAPGVELFDPSTVDVYGFGVLPNVVTALSFERMMSGSGPCAGKLLRPSDMQPARRIAWIQCAGSRNIMIDAPHCSTSCCMFAVKEALLAREKIGPEARTAIFYMDMRTFGRDFQRYKDQAEGEGVEFVRCRIHSIDPADDPGDLKISHVTPDGKLEEAIFDLAVLSTGGRSVRQLPGFADHDGVHVIESGPDIRDIAESVIRAGVAAGKAYEDIRSRRIICADGLNKQKAGSTVDTGTEPQTVEKAALVVGGGPAGLSAALTLARHDMDVTIVERTDRLGGNLPGIGSPGVRRGIEGRIREAESHPRIRVVRQARVISHRGLTGRFSGRIRHDSGAEENISHGAAILATGGLPAPSEAYGLGSHDDIITQFDLCRRLDAGETEGRLLKTVVMVQCAGCREEPRNYCSRICCTQALKNAARIRDLHPEADVTVFYRDIMTLGDEEQLYTDARRKGVLFIPYENDQKPMVRVDSGKPEVRGYDPVMGEEIRLQPDLVALSTGVIPAPAADLAAIFHIDLTRDGFFREADSKWRPVDTPRAGIFVAGLGRAPMKAEAAMREGEAAAYRALLILNHDILAPQQVCARVRPALCSGCQVCMAACPYGARYMDPLTGKALVDHGACQGCGACVTACPNKACFIGSFEGDGVMEMIEEAL